MPPLRDSDQAILKQIQKISQLAKRDLTEAVSAFRDQTKTIVLRQHEEILKAQVESKRILASKIAAFRFAHSAEIANHLSSIPKYLVPVLEGRLRDSAGSDGSDVLFL